MRGGKIAGCGKSIPARGFRSIRRRLLRSFALRPGRRSAPAATARQGAGDGGQGVTDLLRWGSVSFPEKQWLSSRASSGVEFILAHRKSAALGAVAAIGLGASIVLGIFYARYEQMAAAQ